MKDGWISIASQPSRQNGQLIVLLYNLGQGDVYQCRHMLAHSSINVLKTRVTNSMAKSNRIRRISIAEVINYTHQEDREKAGNDRKHKRKEKIVKVAGARSSLGIFSSTHTPLHGIIIPSSSIIFTVDHQKQAKAASPPSKPCLHLSFAFPGRFWLLPASQPNFQPPVGISTAARAPLQS